jgi:GTP cyclohydrolase II
MTSPAAEFSVNPAVVMADRAVEELRRGRAVQVSEGNRWLLLAAVETMEPLLLERLRAIASGRMRLLLTPQRAQAAGLSQDSTDPLEISFPEGIDLDSLRSLAGIASHVLAESASLKVEATECPASVEAAFRLAKLGRLLPALVAVPIPEIADPNLIKISVSDIDRHARSAYSNLQLISRARVPLADAVECDIVLFRQQHGLGEHLAIVIGEPDMRGEVPVRLHSACLTGDLLGSLRCDCGDQLKRAVSRIASLGGGVLLYLDQEGRGIGLANKLRAYALQDTGLDTMDADQYLGFLSDERNYDIAAAMLRELGIQRIRLLTNNPTKINALRAQGIEVTGRLPLVASANSYNRRYLKAKLDRAGHLAE